MYTKGFESSAFYIFYGIKCAGGKALVSASQPVTNTGRTAILFSLGSHGAFFRACMILHGDLVEADYA
jgi:hypothetical protein